MISLSNKNIMLLLFYCLPSDTTYTTVHEGKRKRMCLWMSCVVCAVKRKRRTEDVNASCEEAMEGMMHWQKAKSNGWMKLAHKGVLFFFSLSLSFSFWLVIKKERERETIFFLFFCYARVRTKSEDTLANNWFN